MSVGTGEIFVNAVCALNDEMFVSGSKFNVTVWNVNFPTHVRTFSVDTGFVRAVCALNDNQIVSGYTDGTLKLWKVEQRPEDEETGDPETDHPKPDDVQNAKRTYRGHNDWVNAVCKLNPTQFVSGSFDRT